VIVVILTFFLILTKLCLTLQLSFVSIAWLAGETLGENLESSRYRSSGAQRPENLLLSYLRAGGECIPTPRKRERPVHLTSAFSKFFSIWFPR
jgi:hypothetical protein